MSHVIYWILWFATLCVCGWQITQAVLKPKLLLEWPFLVSVMWLYFYVYMAYAVVIEAEGYITDYALILGQLMPLLSLGGILLGWNLAKPEDPERAVPYAKLNNPLTIWWIGIALVIVGAAGGYKLQADRLAAGGVANFEGKSAYVYMLFYIGYPGMALALWVVSRWQGMESKWTMWGTTVLAIVIFLIPHILYLRRGPTFPAIMLLLLVPSLARKKAPNPVVYISGLALLGIALLVYVQLRTIMYNEGTWNDAFAAVNVKESVTERNKSVTDNEFVNNCHIIEALANNGKYQYGTGHMSLFLHWIPRDWWKGKPALGEGYYTYDEFFEDVAASSGMKLLGGGAAACGVADSFLQYGFLCPFFWMGLSWLASKAFWKGSHYGEIVWMQAYIAFVIASHWLISQGFSAAFVPLVIFLIIPIVILRLFGKIKKRKGGWSRGIRRPSRRIRNQEIPVEPIGASPQP